MSARKPVRQNVTLREVVTELKTAANPVWVAQSQSKFGITTTSALGIRIPVLQKIAKTIGKNHDLAVQLWDQKIHEGRLLAAMIAEIEYTDEALMESWLHDFNSWDMVDGVCGSLFIYHELAWQKAVEWTSREPEYEKRAGFTMMAGLAVHDKKATDKQFEQFFPLISKHSIDSRNFVKKAVNWALRQIGKRNAHLCKRSIAVAESILHKHSLPASTSESRSARWVANDALRELGAIAIKMQWQ